MRRLLTFCIFALLISLSKTAGSHPHAFVDVRVSLMFDQEGRLTGLRQHWLFDEFYTAFATEGLVPDENGNPDPASLLKLAELNLKNLKEYGFFTQVHHGQERVPLPEASNPSSVVTSARLQMSFTLPFQAPINPRTDDISYAIFDPSYYVEMLHAESDQAIMLEGAPEDCSFELSKPNPDPEIAAYAASLGREESGGNSLGITFAERVRLTCGG